ncbi:hypothetical protein VIRA109638_08170 [Vibrio rarus]
MTPASNDAGVGNGVMLFAHEQMWLCRVLMFAVHHGDLFTVGDVNEQFL